MNDTKVITVLPSDEPLVKPLPVQVVHSDVVRVRKPILQTWKEMQWFGSYDYKGLCMPRIPGLTPSEKKPLFFGVEDTMPFFLALLMGFQHALSMMGGLIVPGVVIAGIIGMKQEDKNQIVAVALFACGLTTILHVMQLPIPFTKRIFGKQLVLGTGMISVQGVTFAILSVGISACAHQVFVLKVDPVTAYGNFLGVCALCSLAIIFCSFFPVTIGRLVPPVVSGCTIALIGLGLLYTGFRDWGGGVNCHDFGNGAFGNCKYGKQTFLFGDAHFVGLGFCTFITTVMVEIFGSPLMRNCEVVIGLMVGYIVAAATGYVDNSKFENAPAITFPWVRTYPLGWYTPAVIPVIIAMLVTVVEVVGDVKATAEASGAAIEGPVFEQRIQGGVLMDGINCIIATVMGSCPLTTFAQNNGVIALTKCGSRWAGYACGVWLMLFGILNKLSAVITSIPSPVLGGMTTFLWAQVMCSGLAIINMTGFTRRNRFIIGCAMALGAGTILVPRTFGAQFTTTSGGSEGSVLWPLDASASEGLVGFRDAVIEVLTTGFAIGAISAMILHAVLPYDEEDIYFMEKAGLLSESQKAYYKAKFSSKEYMQQ